MKPETHYYSLRSAQFGHLVTSPLVISLVGGGGKTTTAFWLANQFKKQGHSVFVSTTTKMFLPEQEQADNFINLDNSCLSSLTRTTNHSPVPSITFGYRNIKNGNNKNTRNKVSGVTSELINELKNDSPFTVFIIEADGAKCLPIKAPDRHEPCIPITSDMVIGVTGAEAIHTRATPERIHRWNTFSALTQCANGDIIDHRILGKLIEHQQGMFKHSPEQAIKVWLINKIDLAANYQQLNQLAQQVMTQTTRLDAIWLAAMNNHTPMKDVLTRC